MAIVEIAHTPSSPANSDRYGSGGGSTRPGGRVRSDIRDGVPDALLVVATGVFLVVLAYVRAREGLQFATPLFWSGQVLLFGFVVYRVMNPAVPERERQCLVLLYAGAHSALRWAYSPYMFTFSDELLHLRSLLNVLKTNHLFEVNLSLPISPSYPGTENVAAELTQVSAAGPFLSGVIIAGVSHVFLAGCLLLLFREVTRSSRLAGIAVVLYMLNPHAQYFDTSFAYETVALPFVVLAILFALHFAEHKRNRYQNFVGVVVCFAITSVTHHASAVAGLELLAGIALTVALFRNSRRSAVRMFACVAAGFVVFGCWVYFVAPITLDYLGGPGQQILEDLAKLGQVEGKIDLPGPPNPLFDRVFAAISVVVTLAILVWSVRLVRGQPPLLRSFTWLALFSYAFAVAVRVLVANGAELAGRTLTFTAVLTAPAMAVAFGHLTSPVLHRMRSFDMRSHLVGATALGIVLFLGAVATSVPPWWDRLPGSFRIDGFSSGVDAVRSSKAIWASTNLAPGARVFGDKTSLNLLSTIAELDPIYDPGLLYYTDQFTSEDAALVRAQSAAYLDVDLRMSEQAPITGSYFPIDRAAAPARTPIEIDNLTKFDRIPGFSRIYDSGDNRIYDLRGGGQGAPYSS